MYFLIVGDWVELIRGYTWDNLKIVSTFDVKKSKDQSLGIL